MSQPVTVARDGRTITVTIDRPPLNVLDLETLAALRAYCEGLAADLDTDVGLVVVRGAGPKAFSAGVSVQDHTPDKVAGMLAEFHGGLEALRGLPCLTLAAVHGHCLGGGMELAAACDLVLATESSRFGQPEIELGCFPPYAAALYPGRLGAKKTLELLATGRLFGAAEAERLGFVNWVVPAGDLDARLAEIVAQLTAKSAAVLALLKRGVRAGSELAFAPALAENERLYLEDLTRTDDMNEGLQAFLDKRKPVWKHG